MNSGQIKKRSNVWRTVYSSSAGNIGEVRFASNEVDRGDTDDRKSKARIVLDVRRKHMSVGEVRVSSCKDDENFDEDAINSIEDE